MFVLYDLIFVLYAAVYLPYLLWTRRWYQGYAMRFGFIPSSLKEQIKAKPNIWIHAVSVGEVMVIEGLIEGLKSRFPQFQVIASITTKAGYELARQRLGHKAIVIASPLDLSFIVRHVIAIIRPKIYIVAETEIWPNLYDQLTRYHCPITIVNGRISDTSFVRYRKIRWFLKKILNQASVLCMQSEKDAEKIMALGADPKRVVVTGNIKFDAIAPASNIKIHLPNQVHWWVAGSTHPGEEEIVLDVYAKMVQKDPQWRLIIAPRHMERVEQIKLWIERQGYEVVKYSQLENNSLIDGSRNQVILVDTVGHLRSIYAMASIVFVGKTLCVGGGHNVIEPALFSKPIVVGPYTDNFRDIVRSFKEGQALIQVKDTKEFESVMIDLSSDPHQREALGRAALQIVQKNQGASRRSLDCVTEFLR